jgi:hypothetical protein
MEFEVTKTMMWACPKFSGMPEYPKKRGHQIMGNLIFQVETTGFAFVPSTFSRPTPLLN